MISLWIRNQLTDNALWPLREEVATFIPHGAEVVEVGCANGRFLFDIASQANRCFGLDLDDSMIRYATNLAAETNQPHLQFKTVDALAALKQLPFTPTVTVCSLCLHEMETTLSVPVMQGYAARSERLVIADLYEPDSWLQRGLLHVDEIMAGHYQRFKAYLRQGGMPGLLEQAQLDIIETHDSKIPGIKLWICRAG